MKIKKIDNTLFPVDDLNRIVQVKKTGNITEIKTYLREADNSESECK